jgi:polyhydroxybutyrate depolymerase
MRTIHTFVLLSGLLLSTLNGGIKRVPQDFAKIQLAINDAIDGDTVLISEGTYMENVLISKKIMFGSLYIIDKDTSHISKTIIDGSLPTHADSGSVITISGGADTNTVVSGLTITKGKGSLFVDGTTGWRWLAGGGITVRSKYAKIIRNRILSNSIVSTASNPYTIGGGICAWYIVASDAYYIFEDNEIVGNTISGTQAEAAGISICGGGRVYRNITKNNIAQAPSNNFACGGVSISGHPTNVLMFNCNSISENSSTRLGGGIAIYQPTTAGGPTVHLVNNLIVKNSAVMRGGGVVILQGCTVTLINNTIADNSVAGSAVAVSVEGIETNHSKVIGINNIFWNNGPVNNEIRGADFESLHNNLIRGVSSYGDNNFSADPQFVNDGSYSLSNISPCIAGGTQQRDVLGTLLTAPGVDLHGDVRSRPNGTAPDIGAIESDFGTTSSSRPNRVEVRKFVFGGLTRYYLVLRPKGNEGGKNQGVLMYLHGYDNHADYEMGNLQHHQVGDSLGYITVYPEGYQTRWNSGINDNPGWPAPNVDDVGFISALVDSLRSQYEIDTNRIYVTGYSNGGLMGFRLAAQLAHRIRSVAAVSAVLSVSTVSGYTSTRQIPILMINGTADATVPYNGGKIGWNSVPATLDFWKTKNNAAVADTFYFPNINTGDGSTVERYRYTNSNGRRMLWFYKVIGGSHAWPNLPPSPGITGINRDIDANWEIYNFMKDSPAEVRIHQAAFPQHFELSQNYPNPFNPSTTIRYSLPSSANVKLCVYDLLGREIATLVNEEQFAGWKEIEWNAKDVSSGIYFYKLMTGNYVEVKKLTVVK